MVHLPLIDATHMSVAQRRGRACVSCRKRFPRPTVPVGRLATGEVLYRCPECLVTLESADPDPDPERLLAVQSDADLSR